MISNQQLPQLTEEDADFLKDLPCQNRLNFSDIDTTNGCVMSSSSSRHSNTVKRPPIFVQTKEYPEELVLITTEKSNILLRFLQKEMDKKNKKREALKLDESEASPRKHMKLSSADG